MSKMSLTEATVMALQGRLPLEESVEVYTDETAVVVDNEENVTVSTTDDIEEIHDDVCEDGVCEEPEVVEVPVEGTETIIPEEEISEEQVEEIVNEPTEEEIPTPEEIAEEEVDESKEIKTEDVEEGSIEITEDMTAEDIAQVIVDNYTKITGKEVDSIFTPEDERGENIPIFDQSAVDETSDSIMKFLDEHGVEGKKLEDTLYALDDKLAMLVESKEIKTEDVDDTEKMDTRDRIIAACEAEILIWETVARECLVSMTEEEAKDMVRINEWDLGDYELDESKKCEKDCKKEKCEESKPKFSRESFNESLTKFYKEKAVKSESFNVTKVSKGRTMLKIEGKLKFQNGMEKDKKLTLKKVQEGTSFTKYELLSDGLLKESKAQPAKMMVRNMDNVIKCCYISK